MAHDRRHGERPPRLRVGVRTAAGSCDGAVLRRDGYTDTRGDGATVEWELDTQASMGWRRNCRASRLPLLSAGTSGGSDAGPPLFDADDWFLHPVRMTRTRRRCSSFEAASQWDIEEERAGNH